MESILEAWQFNIPLTFLILSSISIIPSHITETMFSQINAKRGFVSQSITFFSYNPVGLRRYIRAVPVVRTLFNMKRKPIQYRGSKGVSDVFMHSLKSVRGTFLPFLPCNVNSVISGIVHEVEIDFMSLKLENLKLHIHNEVKKIIFRFPFNYDMPKCCPNLFDCLQDVRKKNISLQPLFVDDRQHVRLSDTNRIDLTYTYKCPNCKHDIYEYNCITQKYKNASFECDKVEGVCKCKMCRKHRFKNPHLPH
jgi:hypothetical protein